MKREYREAVKRGIEKSDTNGYKWNITPSGLKWSYLDTKFTFIEEDDGEFLIVRDCFNQPLVAICCGDNKFADCKTLEEAYEMAAIKTIRRANYLY